MACSVSSKAAGNLTCRGCTQHFCTNHVNEHRQLLGKTMDEVMLEHDELKDSLTETIRKRYPHRLMEKIDEWERTSIETIHQTAEKARQQLYNMIERCKMSFTKSINPMTQQLQEYRFNDSFVETDLNNWRRKLQNLKDEFNIPSTVTIEQDYYNKSFLHPILVAEIPNDRFGEFIGDIQIEDSGKVLKHGFWRSYGCARSQGEYSTGCHKIYFKLEDFEVNNFNFDELFFGILSKTKRLRKDIFIGKITYGWKGSSKVSNQYSSIFVDVDHGEILPELDFEKFGKNLRKNDMFELLINCDERKLRLTNVRTNEFDEINIDTTKSPFPWHFCFSLYSSSQRIRLF